MPSVEAALVALLTQGSPNAVHAIAGTRVYPRKLPQNVTYPAIRYTRINTVRLRTLDGLSNYARALFQIDCYGLSESQCVALSQAVYRLLEGFGGVSAGLPIDGIGILDEGADVEDLVGPNGADVYRQRLDFSIPYPEL